MRYFIMAVLVTTCITACPPNTQTDPDASPAVIMNQPESSASATSPEQDAEAPVILPAGWNDDLDDACEEPGQQQLDGANAPTVCSRFCANMRLLRCREGSTPDAGKTCEQNCSHVMESKFMPFDPECGAHASSKAAARKCSGVACR